MIYTYKARKSDIHSSVFMAGGVRIIGDVVIEEKSTIWFNTVLRGDLAPIHVGKRTNIQDGTIGHVNINQPLLISDEVSIGHGAIVHGCKIGKGTLIGMGAIVLNGADIGEYALIGAGSLITENKKIPSYTLSLGSPARVIRELTEDDLQRMKKTMEAYVEKGIEYRNEL